MIDVRNIRPSMTNDHVLLFGFSPDFDFNEVKLAALESSEKDNRL
jgi:hypothetical protein